MDSRRSGVVGPIRRIERALPMRSSFSGRRLACLSYLDAWLSHLADQKAKARILARITSATFGNFSDCEPVGEGVSEMRIRSERDTEFITLERDRPLMFCGLAV